MQDLTLRYRKEATIHEESLPLGNGSLGAMVFGGVTQERIGLNEENLWSGYQRDKNKKLDPTHLAHVRQLIKEKKHAQAEDYVEQHMLGEYTESYLPLGDLWLDFNHQEVSAYERSLCLNTAIASVEYKIETAHYHREYFISNTHKAMFIKLTSTDSLFSFSLHFTSPLFHKQKINEKDINIEGQCFEHVDPSYCPSKDPLVQGDKGLQFKSHIKIIECDGSIEHHNHQLMIQDCSSCVIAIDAVQTPFYEGKTYDEIKNEHIESYQELFHRVELYLGEQSSEPTDVRLENLRKDPNQDLGLYALYFQYGRYLLLSSSYDSVVPANLQGIWNWEVRPPWSSNYTTNINLQMNYWLAQSTNLQECLSPYFSFLERLVENGKKTAREVYQCNGFVVHHNTDYWASTNPVGVFKDDQVAHKKAATWSMWPMGGLWLCQELMKHYEYSQDIEFLKNKVYPILKEAVAFVNDWLIQEENHFTTSPSSSPENRFVCEGRETSSIATGSTMDLTLIKEVTQDFEKACSILGIEDPLCEEILQKVDSLVPFQIGSLGQLLEWDHEYEEEEKGHRHISHLYGLFPSELFEQDPKLKEACRKSLEIRLANGGGHTGWSCAWILNMYAILKDRENAYLYLQTLLCNSTYPNLWDAHPPFQIDGNFGGSAGIANMLVQDRAKEIKLLPALPKEWKNGYVKGLCIKNNKCIDLAWQDGKLTDYKIYTK